WEFDTVAVFFRSGLFLRTQECLHGYGRTNKMRWVKIILTPCGEGQQALLLLGLCICCDRRLWINRITAASQEHGLKYPSFISNLIKCQVELNRKVLADLAIYEPKTFKSLAALAKRRREEGLAAALGDEKEPAGIFSRVVHYQ
uniref:Large ribosomal subunit protein bL20m n=1 Tax=Sarcophilus harrisii TaxID=9305 RepID=A0A7N4NSQ3_SARHA